MLLNMIKLLVLSIDVKIVRFFWLIQYFCSSQAYSSAVKRVLIKLSCLKVWLSCSGLLVSFLLCHSVNKLTMHICPAETVDSLPSNLLTMIASFPTEDWGILVILWLPPPKTRYMIKLKIEESGMKHPSNTHTIFGRGYLPFV